LLGLSRLSDSHLTMDGLVLVTFSMQSLQIGMLPIIMVAVNVV
jgi:hypothetical protein